MVLRQLCLHKCWLVALHTLQLHSAFVPNAAVNISVSDEVKGEVYKVLSLKGTPVILGTLANTGSTLRVAFENGGTHWTASALDAALKALGTVDSIDLSGTDAVAFTY